MTRESINVYMYVYVCTKNGQRREYDGEMASDVHPMYTLCTPDIHHIYTFHSLFL